MSESLSFTLGLDTGPFDRAMRQTEGKARSFGNAVSANLLKVASAAGAVVAGLGAIGVSAVQEAAKFEALEARLATILGSAGEGRKRLDELFSVASSTPFQLDQLVEADVILEGYGQNAESLRSAVMDLSGALGMNLTESASAVGRAMSAGAGSADLLRERGVLAMVELRTGIKATEMDAEAFRAALVETLTDPDGKIAGGTAKLANTMTGLLSNVRDEVTKINIAIADAGAFDAAKNGARELLRLIEDNRDTINEIAASLGTGIVVAMQSAVYVAGLLVDGFDLVDMAVQSARMGVAAIPIAFGEAVGMARDLAAELGGIMVRYSEFAGQENAAAMWRRFEADRRDAADEIRVWTREIADDLGGSEAAERFREIQDNLGRGSEAAERINRALTRGRGGTQTIDRGGADREQRRKVVEAETQAIDEQALALDELAAIESRILDSRREMYLSRLTEEEQIRVNALAEIDAIQAIADARADDEVVQREAADAMMLVELDAIERIREARAVADEEARRATIERRDLIVSSAATAAGAFAGAFRAASQIAANSGGKAAKALFVAFKGLAVAQASFEYGVGLMRAASITVPVARGLQVAAVTAGYATSLATIATAQPPTPQTFDIGGTVLPGGTAYTPMAQTPDQVSVRALPGETVTDRETSREYGGADGIRAALEGRAGQSASVEVTLSRSARKMFRQSRRGGSSVGRRSN